MKNFQTAIPPLDEQQAIASFLDVETSKIDSLVAEQRRLIELLKEKRQAVISHAVTKGLNPNAPMKPSGIQWLGDVPEHWEMTRFGWMCDYISYGFTNPMPVADEGPYMLTANDVDYGNVKYDTARCTTLDAYENLLTDKCRPIKNDLLLTKDGTLGRIAVHDGRQACINQSVALLRVTKSKVNPEFACLALQGGLYQRRMIYEAGGTTIKHIYISRLAKMPMAFPNLDEQGKVVVYLNDRLSKFDGLIAEAERAIELLQERRTALISAAVTGKIDVRNFARGGAEIAEKCK
ncbi:MAG: restriction endonuclease subunit S [Pirellulaceae bacterium]